MQHAAATRTDRWHHPWRGIGMPPAQNRTNDARDHVARFLDNHPVACPNVFPSDVIGVVERGHRYGRTGYEHRIEHCEGRHGSRAPDVHLDALEERRLLLRRELERNRPARKLARRAQASPQVDAIELDDYAVGVEFKRTPL